ncbi:hypothetical protein UY3_05473 [Chelonia mydas]|uniref:Uncharacterized protein n=1 Tax=Chelonia mydas TaxID=8469 RepID=M7BZ41_CHEMY|nr:hypothetical protein UY3_05473 [Chelonia mydas]
MRGSTAAHAALTMAGLQPPSWSYIGVLPWEGRYGPKRMGSDAESIFYYTKDVKKQTKLVIQNQNIVMRSGGVQESTGEQSAVDLAGLVKTRQINCQRIDHCSVNPPKYQGGAGTIKGRLCRSVGPEPVEETDASALLWHQKLKPAFCHVLPPEETNRDEELLGLPAAVYLEDLWRPEIPNPRDVGSSSGTADNWLATGLTTSQSACCAWIPADPAADHSDTDKTLGWDMVE